MKSKITAVIPTFRRPRFLKHAIQSVLDQTEPNLTVLVCDNLSNDETKDVVMAFSKFDSRVEYYCQPEHVSMIDNFEKGLSLVKTPYYSLLSDDDFLFPSYYDLAIRALENNPKAAMFCGSTMIVDENRDIFRKAQLLHDGSWDIHQCPKEQMISVISQIVIQACVFRKGDYGVISGINPSAGWDEMMTWNFVLNYPIITSSKFVVGYRRHSGQDSLQNVGVDVPNEVKLEKLLKNAPRDVREKVRFIDKKKKRVVFFVKMVLTGEYEIAKGTLQLIRRYNVALYGALFLFLSAAKIKFLKMFFSRVWSCMQSAKKFVLRKKTEDREVFEIIHKYADPI